MSIAIRQVDDWVALYKDGVKVAENHSLRLEEGLRALGIPFSVTTLDEDGHTFDPDRGTFDGGLAAFPEAL